MDASWTKLFKSIYRKEKISSFIVIVGAVDAVIGGVDQHVSLLTFGLGTVGLAIAWRWWQIQQSEIEPPQQTAKYYLPPQSSRPAMPVLSTNKRTTNK